MRLLLLFNFLIVFPSTAYAELYNLKTPTFDSRPKYYKENNKIIGLCIDLLHEVEKVEPALKFMGMDEQLSFIQVEKQVLDGTADVFLCNADTEERQINMRKIMPPIFQAQSVLVARIDDQANIKSLKDLQDLYPNNLVLSWRGTEQNTWILQKTKVMTDQGINGVNSMDRLFQMLLSNRGRFLFVQKYTALNTIKKLKLENKVKILFPPLTKSNRYIWLSKKVPENIALLLEKAIANLKNKGVLSALAKKYDIE